MDHAIQQKLAPKDIDVTYQDPGSRHLLQNRQHHTERVTQHHQTNRDYTLQHPSTSNSMVPQYAQSNRADTFQQHFSNREIHQEDGAPPLPVTQANMFDIRDKKCQSKRDLRAHEDGKGVKKQNVCKFCHKVFRYKCVLKQHMVIHSREKPYVCGDCSRRFKRTSALTRHMLTHTGEKPYVCTVCKQAFAQKYNLTLHSLIHTGEKKYMCEICNQCFTSKQNLNIHQLKHSENTVFKQKKANKNTNVSKTQEVRNSESELEQQRICVKQQRQVPQSTGYLAQTVATFVGSKSSHEHASLTNVHQGATANTQSFVPIEQPSMHMVPQFLNLDARRHPLIQTVGQQNISHSVPHVLRQIGHTNPGRIDHQSLASLRQAVDTIKHTLTPKINQNLNIGAQSLNQLITVDQQDVADLGYQGLAQIGHRTHGQIGHRTIARFGQRPNTTLLQPPMVYPMHSTMASVSKYKNKPQPMQRVSPCDECQKKLNRKRYQQLYSVTTNEELILCERCKRFESRF